MCRLNNNREWRKEWERGVSGDDVCDCSFGEQLDNKKPFRPLYIFKHMLKNNFVLFIRECRITTDQKSKVFSFCVLCPVLLCLSVPVLLCVSGPVLLCVLCPVLLYVSVPVLLCVSGPVLLCVLCPVLLCVSEFSLLWLWNTEQQEKCCAFTWIYL